MNTLEITGNALFDRILADRGFCSKNASISFLAPKLADLPPPHLMQNLDRAADTVVAALTRGDHILIWGDYDVDGTTGTALLVKFLRYFSKRVSYHIPNRLSDGYGLNVATYKKLIASRPPERLLVLTVDCGISNIEEVSYITGNGTTVIVTDHHAIPESGGPNCIVVNPSDPNCRFAPHNLCGASVAFYLAAAVLASIRKNSPDIAEHCSVPLKHFLAFSALGTVADIVHLSPVNRIVTRAGIEILEQAPPPGLKALLEVAGIGAGKISSEDLGYTICPMLNAAGRMGDSETAVALMLEDDPAMAKKLAKKLYELNTQRKQLTSDTLRAITGDLHPAIVQEEGFVFAVGPYHPGILGIAASKLVEKFGIPAMVVSNFGDSFRECVGSARSTETIHLARLLEKCSKWLVRFGGHAMAAGFSILQENIPGFRSEVSTRIKDGNETRLFEENERATYRTTIDTVMDPNFLQLFEKLEPFGPGNEKPVFVDSSVKIIDSRRVGGNGEHLSMIIRGNLENYRAIGFHLGEKQQYIQEKPQCSLRFSPTRNRYRNTVSWQVHVSDIS